MANAATPHPILNPTSPPPKQAGAGGPSALPAARPEPDLFANVTVDTVAGAMAPKIVGMVILWAGRQLLAGLGILKR
jgi:hypothetical protein